MWIASAARMKEIDRRATEEFGVSIAALMEQAGRAVFDAMSETLPPPARVAIFCGKGHNGGDGFAIARLATLSGYEVEVLVAARESELAPATHQQYQMCRDYQVPVFFYDDPAWTLKSECVSCRDIVIDAVLGTGANGEVTGAALDAIIAMNQGGVPVISIDVPSGIHADTGEDLGESVWAMRTVTLGLPKPCFFQGIGLEHSGYWTVDSIGLPPGLLHESTGVKLVDPESVGNLIPERMKSSHKGDHGRVLIVAGCAAMPGAALLCAKGAVRSGAGLVTVAAIPSVCQTIASALPEVTFLPLEEQDGAISPASSAIILREAHRFDSAIFGPGLSMTPGVGEFLGAVWADWDLPSCIDADALNWVAKGITPPRYESIFTPHPGELSRLLRTTTAEIQGDRFGTVRRAVDEFQRAILLKGPFSIIGDRGLPLSANPTGNPGMASAGMGDVLSGMIGTLLAQDLPPYLAGIIGSYWHGVAGDLCAEQIGLVGYRASEVAITIPAARAKITASCEAHSDSVYSGSRRLPFMPMPSPKSS